MATNTRDTPAHTAAAATELPADQPTPPAGGRRAGRGGLAVSAAKIYFILAGLVQQVALKGVLGLEGYGALSSALSAASIAYNPIVAASIQGVSHAVATARDGEREQVLRRVLRIHAYVAVLLGTAFLLLSSSIGQLTGADHIVAGLRVLSAVLVVYGLYAPLVGALNGLTRFGTQAGLDALAATLRTVGLIGGAALLARFGSPDFGGVEGATLGFAASSVLVLLVAAGRVGLGRAGGARFDFSGYLRYISPILLGQVLLNLLFQADQLLLRRFAADAAVAAGLDGAAADPLVGAYRAIQLFCFLPYQLVLSISIVLFPMLARAHREGRRETVALYVQRSMRLALLVGGLIVSITCGLSAPLLRLVFGADTAALGTAPMQLLSLGLGTLALLGVLTAVLNSLEEQRLGLIVTGLAFALVVGLCLQHVRGLPFGPDLLWHTAWATTIALTLATLVAAWLVRRKVGTVLGLGCTCRVLAALAGAVLIGRWVPTPSRLLTPLSSLLVAAAYVAILIALRELGADDWSLLRSVVSKQPSRHDQPPRSKATRSD